MRNLALAILNIFSYFIKPLFITNFSLPPSIQTSCRCLDNSISALTICTGCSRCILLHCGGFAQLTGDLISTLGCISHTQMPSSHGRISDTRWQPFCVSPSSLCSGSNSLLYSNAVPPQFLHPASLPAQKPTSPHPSKA